MMNLIRVFGRVAVILLLGTVFLHGNGIIGCGAAAEDAATTSEGEITETVYDDFENASDAAAYSMIDYEALWTNSYGLGEMAIEETRSFDGGEFSVEAVPFATGADFSVFDHLKYFAASTSTFDVPAIGSVTFAMDLTVEAPGAEPAGREVTGTYTDSGAPYSATVLETQQASASINVVDFATGQLFDWLVSEHTAITLVERLPSTITGNTEDVESEDYVGIDKMYTQIIEEFPLDAGPHNYAITYTREETESHVEYFLDGELVSRVDQVGIPLDVQGVNYTGTYPSLGDGEILKDKINSFTMAHGLFSLIDAFPFQHADAPELSVSIPLDQRLFGQGIHALYDNFTVTTVTR